MDEDPHFGADGERPRRPEAGLDRKPIPWTSTTTRCRRLLQDLAAELVVHGLVGAAAGVYELLRLTPNSASLPLSSLRLVKSEVLEREQLGLRVGEEVADRVGLDRRERAPAAERKLQVGQHDVERLRVDPLGDRHRSERRFDERLDFAEHPP